MRDLIITLMVFGSLPFFFKKPYIGVLMWIWISVMNPHQQAWGFAASFPFAAIIAATMFASLLVSKEPKGLPLTAVSCTFIAFVLWINVSTIAALNFDQIYPQWNKVMKIMLMNLVVLSILKTREHIRLFIWVLVISLGFYGVKGGIFTILSGGQYRVWGPDNSFIAGNNEVALALVVVIPLMYYLYLEARNKWLRYAMIASILLCALASLGSYSRGALVAIAAMAGFLWLKSSKKLALGILMLMTIPVLVVFMPDKWGERMDTISTYKEDSSAMGRVNAWQMAFNLAKDRPLVGGGFEIYDAATFQRYAPIPTDVHAAHSIYFQALGEHGFVGLGLYLLLAVLTWRTGSWIIRNTRQRDDLKWAFNLASMIQVSLIGFGVGGAFLSLLYFDVPYYLMIAMIVVRNIVEKELAASGTEPTRNDRVATRRKFKSPSSGRTDDRYAR